ncbi:MAG: carbon-nitrogen hydrolase family protein [Candidatus Latescibacterota bacterium]|jgi:predicted amidohydrolase
MESEVGLLWPVAQGGGAWQEWTPMPSLSPQFVREERRLGLIGNGNPHVFGAWCRRVPAIPGQAYRLRVVLRGEGVEDAGLHLSPQIVWRRGERPEEECSVDAVRGFRLQDELLVGEDTFVAPANCDGAEVRILLRYAAEARIWVEEVSLIPGELPASRPLRVAVTRGCPAPPSTLAANLDYYGGCLDRAAALGADLVLLPEFANYASLPAARGEALLALAEPIPGPFCRMLAERARRHGCWVVSGLLEREGEFIFNTAVLFDRRGELAGTQRKVHPYWPEEPLGVLPGESFAPIPTEFGSVGIMICYDSWWPESARLLALRGAELILFPNAGYEEKILAARAIDNNVYLAASSLYSPAAILDPRGNSLATSAAEGVIAATVDLNLRPKCHPNAGGNLNPGPGGSRWARNARSNRLYEEILAEVSRGVRDR